jgi:hypothetical protein
MWMLQSSRNYPWRLRRKQIPASAIHKKKKKNPGLGWRRVANEGLSGATNRRAINEFRTCLCFLFLRKIIPPFFYFGRLLSARSDMSLVIFFWCSAVYALIAWMLTSALIYKLLQLLNGVFIFNSVCIGIFYVTRRIKLDPTYICFE